MDFSTDRAKVVEQYKNDPRSFMKDKKFGIPWRSDKLEDFQVYRFPIEILSFNFDNARIRAEKISKEEMLKRKLEEQNKADQDIVMQILLESVWLGKTDTDLLMQSIAKQQHNPAIITFDGIVIDGNRRLACIRTLHRKTGNPEYSSIELCILPKANKKDLITLENRLQLSRSYKVEYGPVNDRLRLREQLRELGFSLPEIKYSINDRWDEAQITTMIEEMDLIDEYLEAIGRPKDYPSIENKGVESFTALLQGLRAPVGQVPKAKEAIEKYKRKLVGFQVISHPETTYSDLRQLRDIYRKPQASQEFLLNCEIYTNPKAADPFKIEKVKDVMSNVELTASSLRAQKTDPVSLAKQALDKLNNIDASRIPKQDAKFADLMNRITRKLEQINKKLAGR